MASTTSLPSYSGHSICDSDTPSYSFEPLANEHRLALASRIRPQASGEFFLCSKNQNVALRLIGQEHGLNLPMYGQGSTVEGFVEVDNPEGVYRIDVKASHHISFLVTGLLWIFHLRPKMTFAARRAPRVESTCGPTSRRLIMKLCSRLLTRPLHRSKGYCA